MAPTGYDSIFATRVHLSLLVSLQGCCCVLFGVGYLEWDDYLVTVSYLECLYLEYPEPRGVFTLGHLPGLLAILRDDHFLNKGMMDGAVCR